MTLSQRSSSVESHIPRYADSSLCVRNGNFVSPCTCIAPSFVTQLIRPSPIFTYNNQGTLKHGVVPREHAIAYSIGYQPPTLLPGEVEIVKQPIGIVMKPGEPCLAAASRIYFGIHHPIQYNVKVKDLGDVHPNDLVNLKGYWNMENQTDTNQDIDVTAQAAWESPQQYGGLPDQPQHQSSRRRQQG
jgi:hypothetical protein